MRLLTFMQMAESKKEISFNTILEELQLPDNDVEAFVIDGELKFLFSFILTKVISLYQFKLLL